MARRRGSHLAALNRKRKLKKANDSSPIPVSTEPGDHHMENPDGDESQSQDNISDLEEEEIPQKDPLNTEFLHDAVNDKGGQTEKTDELLNVEKTVNDTKFTDLNILNSEISSTENQEKIGNIEAEPRSDTLANDSDRKSNGDADSQLNLLNESKSNEIEEAKEMEENLNKDNEEEEAVDIEDAKVSGNDTNDLSHKDPSTNIEDDFLKQVKVDKATGTTTFEFDGIALKYKERSSVLEEKEGLIEFRVVNSDNTRENMMVLTGLKNIFQKQLPKMPKEYIARLVYDRSHLSMAIIRKPLTVVGGITYKPFNDRGFAEIVFCAISSTEQVRGYGAHLMNHLKDYVKLTSPIKYFLTYADNYAIGYFKKQGFTKDVTLDRRLWMGYIKDYEGGTLMQCSMLPKIRYLDAGKVLLLQEAAIRRKIRTLSRMHIVQPGLEHFKDLKNIVPMNPMDIPGIQESGWTPEMDELAQKPKRGPHYGPMQSILTELQSHNAAWPFLQPVNKNEVADYYEFIKEPMDLSTMETKLENNKYENFEDFIYDARLICKNCRAYNGENTSYFKYANKLEKFFYSKVKEYPEYAGLID